jgi:hypothetical protein
MSTNTQPATTLLWPLIYGLGIVAFSFFLLALRAGIIFFIIFIIAGLAMIVFWVYYNARNNQNIDINLVAKQPCRCAICSHEKASLCLNGKCACCIVVKGKSIVGHTNSSLQ